MDLLHRQSVLLTLQELRRLTQFYKRRQILRHSAPEFGELIYGLAEVPRAPVILPRFVRRLAPDVPAPADVSEILAAVFFLPVVRPADPAAAALQASFHVGSQLGVLAGS
jgi:hypothetical protein